MPFRQKNLVHFCVYLLIQLKPTPKNITGRGPIIANLHVTRERTRIFRPFFADDKWWHSRQQNPTFVSWLIQKKSGKIPLETIPLYTNLTALGRHLEEMPDRKILLTPSYFVVRPFLLTSLLIYISFPTSNKMAIIGTFPSRFSDKNQQLYKRSLIRACA